MNLPVSTDYRCGTSTASKITSFFPLKTFGSSRLAEEETFKVMTSIIRINVGITEYEKRKKSPKGNTKDAEGISERRHKMVILM